MSRLRTHLLQPEDDIATRACKNTCELAVSSQTLFQEHRVMTFAGVLHGSDKAGAFDLQGWTPHGSGSSIPKTPNTLLVFQEQIWTGTHLRSELGSRASADRDII